MKRNNHQGFKKFVTYLLFIAAAVFLISNGDDVIKGIYTRNGMLGNMSLMGAIMTVLFRILGVFGLAALTSFILGFIVDFISEIPEYYEDYKRYKEQERRRENRNRRFQRRYEYQNEEEYEDDLWRQIFEELYGKRRGNRTAYNSDDWHDKYYSRYGGYYRYEKSKRTSEYSGGEYYRRKTSEYSDNEYRRKAYNSGTHNDESKNSYEKTSYSYGRKRSELDEAKKLFDIHGSYTEADLKKQRNVLLRKFHPDNGGTNEDCQRVNQAYELLLRYM